MCTGRWDSLNKNISLPKKIKIGGIFIRIPPPHIIVIGVMKIVRVIREWVDLRLTPPGRQPWKISLKTCNYVTLACKRGKARKLKTQSLTFQSDLALWQI